MADIFFSIAPVADKIIMVILALFSFLVVGISLERYFFLKPVYRKSRQTMRKLKDILQSGKLSEMEQLAQDTKHPAGRSMARAMAYMKENGPKGLERLFRASYFQEKALLEGSISVLATIGSNAPFVGLLGTVFGIMRAFHDLGTAQEVGQQTVMTGISIALLATALGLAVAIPAVMLYNYFRRTTDKVLNTLENVGELGLAYSQRIPSAPEKSAENTKNDGSGAK